jgi:type IV pilus modification protein PilV
MSRGFSLVEALVALAVLSVGLLGAAALLLGGLRDQSLALRHGAVNALLADMAARIRANVAAGAAYDTASARSAEAVCDEGSPCDAPTLAALDLARFESAAAALLPVQRPRPHVSYEPAIGPAAPSRFVISLGWDDPREPGATDERTLILLAQPVAGAP